MSLAIGELRIRELDAADLGPAAELYAAGFGRALAELPELPDSLLDPAPTRALLEQVHSRGLGVAATRNGALVGYLLGLPAPGLRTSGTAVYVPDWCHAATEPQREALWEALYARAAAAWLERGWRVQCVSMLAGDAGLERTLGWLGFGLFSVDAVRGVDQAGPPAPSAAETGFHVGLATLDDVEALAELSDGEEDHYSASPTFLHRPARDARERVREHLSAPGHRVWVARDGGRIVAYILTRPVAPDACRALRDPLTLGIGHAFTTTQARGRGAGAAVFEAIDSWAREEGYLRLAVDFESANVLARRFWLRRFRPVCMSLERHLDDRLAVMEAGQ